MNDIFATRLADCLESLKRGEATIQECLQKYPQDSEELGKLLELAVLLEKTPVQPPDAQFEKNARARILNSSFELETSGGQNWFIHWVSEIALFLSGRPAFRLVLIAFLLVLVLSSGVVFASAKAMPGDFLYPVKIFLEDARLMISGEEKGTNLQIDRAAERLKEVDRLIEVERYETISDVVDRYVIQIDQLSESITSSTADEDAVIDERSKALSENLKKNIEVLEGLLEKVPEQAQPAIEKAIEASSKNQDKLEELFPDGKPGGGPKDKEKDKD